MRFLCSLQFWPQQLTRSPGLGYRLEPPMRGRALFHPVILALAVLAILSHTCVLPLYAEAHQELVAPHAPPTETHGDEGSCEAASPGPSYSVPAPVPAPAAVAALAPPVVMSPALIIRPVLSRSSPLFLLHLTLRI